MARYHAVIMTAALLLVLLPAICAKGSEEWDHTESWEESDSPAAAHKDAADADNDVEPVDDGEEDEEEDATAPTAEYLDTDDEAERDVDEQTDNKDDDEDEEEDEEDQDEESIPGHVTGQKEEKKGAVQMVDEPSVSQVRMSDRSPASCAVYAMGNKVEDRQVCTEGNTGSCLTSKIEIKMDGEMKTMYTSNCDKMQLCQGMGKGYYEIEDGKCGTMPGEGGQKIYCSRTSPEDGRIPNGVDCPKINMRVPDSVTGKPNNAGTGHRSGRYGSGRQGQSQGDGVVRQDQSQGRAAPVSTPRTAMKRAGAGTVVANTLLMGASVLAVVVMAQ